MCQTVITTEGTEIETLGELEEHIGYENIVFDIKVPPNNGACLCQVDLEACYKKAGINYIIPESRMYLLEVMD